MNVSYYLCDSIFFLFKINNFVLYDMPKSIGNKNIPGVTKILFSLFTIQNSCVECILIIKWIVAENNSSYDE